MYGDPRVAAPQFWDVMTAVQGSIQAPAPRKGRVANARAADSALRSRAAADIT